MPPAEFRIKLERAESHQRRQSLHIVSARQTQPQRCVQHFLPESRCKSLRNLYPGESLRFGIDAQGRLSELHYIKSALERYVFKKHQDSYKAEHIVSQPEVMLSYREGIIQDSLYLSAAKAELPDKLIMELANIFGWDVDFVFDIRQGDSFSLLFEDRYLEGENCLRQYSCSLIY